MWSYMVFLNVTTGEHMVMVANYGVVVMKIKISEAWLNAQIYGDEYGSEE